MKARVFNFTKFSRRCPYHLLIKTKIGHRAICKLLNKEKCNSYNCPRKKLTKM